MKTIAFLFSFLSSACMLFAQDTYLHCGKIVDVDTGKILSEKTIVVSQNKIKLIADGYSRGTKNDIVVDLKDKVILPGFIDMHDVL